LNHLIVARFDENTEWTQQIDGWRVHVIQKGRDLPNGGREPSSFFWAFWHLYKRFKPTDTIACVQGNPFDHGDLILREADEFVAMGQWRVECDHVGAPHHAGIPVAEKCEKWFGEIPPEQILFTAGGQFLIPGRMVLERPRAFYKGMVAEMNDGMAPWVMERLWELMFVRGWRGPQGR
jgi:hypothetical protein